ncbi:dTDP-glucose 4,6-dehydratase [Sporolactobacillus shoreicorticis]|uniref:dTDP-glucose 4,6-dehydratase n=1 Tax=Sporolactobacillus shoreicorticis TaxID=1923877 RepID=A0ABW5S3H7_9BACL|nr:dTDP-glucose 4,6-dehydratase [Sporolactobacillus shoreicorticis]MCO7124193.1 dTDP-glucose 4,6-dehydratase [Sporolactobacillus shoreicorticis]
MNLLITGGAGFIGSNFIHYMLTAHPNDQIINLDLLTYAGNLENLCSVSAHQNYHFIHGNICNKSLIEKIIDQFHIDSIINFAAESHVDRSIDQPGLFVKTNVLGTQILLDAAKKHQFRKYIQISTDEVYGSLDSDGSFTEKSPLAPNSPYAASKASADLLTRAYFKTFGLNINITRCSNNYGPYQFPEKLIPLIITNAIEDQVLPVYGDGAHVRDWIYVSDHCVAIDQVLHHGKPGEIYNIGADHELHNIDLVKHILDQLHKPYDKIKYVSDRPGHDRRYAINTSKIRSDLNWQPQYDFEKGINQTIQWYLKHKTWWKKIKNGAFKDYYNQHYGKAPE